MSLTVNLVRVVLIQRLHQLLELLVCQVNPAQRSLKCDQMLRNDYMPNVAQSDWLNESP